MKFTNGKENILSMVLLSYVFMCLLREISKKYMEFEEINEELEGKTQGIFYSGIFCFLQFKIIKFQIVN